MNDLIKLIKEAGQIALNEQKKLTVDYKKDKTVVTNGDLLVSKFLETELAKLYPAHTVFSEENSETLPSNKNLIIIDPIDGTQSYARGDDSWSVLIGFLENGIPTKGLVYHATKNILYYASKNDGAYCEENGVKRKLEAQGNGELSGVSSLNLGNENKYLESIGISKINQMYGAGLKMMEVATGRSDIYPSLQMKCSIWDIIAPQVILEEAGGKLVYKKDLQYNLLKTEIDSEFIALGKRLINQKF